MKLHRLWAVARKEFLHVLRDPRSLGMAFAIPMLMLILFGYALTLDVDMVPLVVWDQSRTVASRELVDRLAGSRYFSLVRCVDDYGEICRAIDAGEARLALVVPREFAARVHASRNEPVQLIADGSDSNTAQIAMGYAELIVRAYSQDQVLRQMRLEGLQTIVLPLDPRPRVWFNEDMESRNAIVPGLIAVIMMVITALLTSLTVAREWERGTMEQLIATPVRTPELILGKLIPYFTVGMLDMLAAVLMGHFLFHIPFRGSLVLLFGLSAVFVVGVNSLGILLSTVAKNQVLASQLAMLTTLLPSFLLSGFMIPIANMPKAVQAITYLVPARYFVVLLRGIYLKGVGLETLGGPALLLSVFGAAMILLANLRFKKKLI